MKFNADLTQAAALLPHQRQWIASPTAGVERQLLDRNGGEVARATSLVAYRPGSRFNTHVHGGGEEFFVLNGVFSDEHGDYPAGTYCRNPIGTSHAPRSRFGCTLFVKLHQFDRDDTTPVTINTATAAVTNRNGLFGAVPGAGTVALHRHRDEHVALLKLAPGCDLPTVTPVGGLELLVLDGTMTSGQTIWPSLSWLRLPDGAVFAGGRQAGGHVLAKWGHLPKIPPRP